MYRHQTKEVRINLRYYKYRFLVLNKTAKQSNHDGTVVLMSNS